MFNPKQCWKSSWEQLLVINLARGTAPKLLSCFHLGANPIQSSLRKGFITSNPFQTHLIPGAITSNHKHPSMQGLISYSHAYPTLYTLFYIQSINLCSYHTLPLKTNPSSNLLGLIVWRKVQDIKFEWNIVLIFRSLNALLFDQFVGMLLKIFQKSCHFYSSTI